uniref:hypothetical protein n=1 Tax=Promicromonospora sp. CA-291202 TaxID=3240016 RepID=UPI003F491410
MRTWLEAGLDAELDDGWTFITYDSQITPAGLTVMFFRSRVVPTPEAPDTHMTHTITLYVATAKQVGSAALDALDVALDAVLVALYALKNVTWTSATYKVLNDTVPVFEVLVQVPSNIVATEN